MALAWIINYFSLSFNFQLSVDGSKLERAQLPTLAEPWTVCVLVLLEPLSPKIFVAQAAPGFRLRLNWNEFEIGLKQIRKFRNCTRKIYSILNWKDETRFLYKTSSLKRDWIERTTVLISWFFFWTSFYWHGREQNRVNIVITPVYCKLIEQFIKVSLDLEFSNPSWKLLKCSHVQSN